LLGGHALRGGIKEQNFMAEPQPNKPGGGIKPDGSTRAPGDEQAVENQTSVTPDDYPDGSGGKPDYKDRDKA
jgi:hypothetical protein